MPQRTLSEHLIKECSIKVYPVGSILIAMIGEGKTRGSVAYLATEACINQNFACAVPKKGVDGWFLFYYLNNCYEQLRCSSHGSNQGALNCRILKEFPVPELPYGDQLKVVDVFRILDEEKIKIKAQVDSILNMRKLLLQYFLSKDER